VAKALERRAAVRKHLLQGDLELADLLRYQRDFPAGEEKDEVARAIRFARMDGAPAPALQAEAWVQGGPLSFEGLHGKVVALFFFATWCEKCAKELPFLLAVERRFSSAGLVFVGVLDHSHGQTVESTRTWLAKSPIRFAVLMDGGKVSPAYQDSSIPAL